MADERYRHPRLAAVYDPLDPDRRDLDPYLRRAEEAGARRVLDIGCDTGVFALLPAERGTEVVGVDPAEASLEVARGKPGGERVRWIHGDATTLPPLAADLATMTANVAQEITCPEDWQRTLRGIRAALRPGGRLMFETRIPARRAWEQWNREATYGVTEVAGVGARRVLGRPARRERTPGDVTYVFAADGQTPASGSTLRFRERQEIEAELAARGFVVEDVRDVPDRPGREFVFLARRPETVR